jgi:hypothetical protein
MTIVIMDELVFLRRECKGYYVSARSTSTLNHSLIASICGSGLVSVETGRSGVWLTVRNL